MVFACTKLGKIAGMLNLALYQGILLKARVPKFLVPRRKYEVDESMRLVQFGLPKVKMMMKGSQKLITLGRDARENYLPGRQELAGFGRSAHGTIGRQLQKPVLFFQWGRVPKDWELSFVSTMKMAESQGIPFAEVLQTNLPAVLGEAPSGVLLRWVGRSARSQPKRFAKVVSKMFGPSGKRIVTGLESSLDPERMLEAHREPEEPFQSVIDAIRKADEEKEEATRYLQRRRRPSSHA